MPQLPAQVPAINWAHFDQYPPDTIECTCGATYKSHAKGVMNSAGDFIIATRQPCPKCKRTHGHVRAARSDPQAFSV